MLSAQNNKTTFFFFTRSLSFLFWEQKNSATRSDQLGRQLYSKEPSQWSHQCLKQNSSLVCFSYVSPGGSDLQCGYQLIRLEKVTYHPFSPGCMLSWVLPEASLGVGWRCEGADVDHLCLSVGEVISQWRKAGDVWVLGVEYQSLARKLFTFLTSHFFRKFSYLCHALSRFFLHRCLHFLSLYRFLLCHFYLSRQLRLAFPDQKRKQTSRSSEWKGVAYHCI